MMPPGKKVRIPSPRNIQTAAVNPSVSKNSRVVGRKDLSMSGVARDMGSEIYEALAEAIYRNQSA
jgi:hypothetical protein